MRLLMPISAACILTLSGCASVGSGDGTGGGYGEWPTVPELTIKNVNEKRSYSAKDSFEVNAPLAKVTATLKEKSGECLNGEIVSTSRQGGLTRKAKVQLTPKLTSNKRASRLTMQVKATQGAISLGDAPPDGWYFMVVDATPINSKTTHVDAYFQYPYYRGAFSAIKPWLTGENMGCPDLTQ